jgi:hypothetical protein
MRAADAPSQQTSEDHKGQLLLSSGFPCGVAVSSVPGPHLLHIQIRSLGGTVRCLGIQFSKNAGGISIYLLFDKSFFFFFHLFDKS